MGVLEEAIREHLELKRRHGASDEELLREEVEALGPARREAAPAEEAPAEYVPGEDIASAPIGEPPLEPAPPVSEAAPEPELPGTQEPPPAQEPPLAREPDDGEPSEVPAEEALEEPASAERFRPEDEILGEETAVYKAPGMEPEPRPGETADPDFPAVTEDGAPVEEDEAAEDEEPERDRLWPERKPPPDFDFE